jgi:DNA-binding IscR family transcriptional regulator
MIGDIVRVIDGPLAPIPCASVTAYRRCADCDDERTCEVRRLMREVRDAAAMILDHKSLADAAGKKPGRKTKSARSLRKVA